MQPYQNSNDGLMSASGLDAALSRVAYKLRQIDWLESVYGRAFRHKEGDYVIPKIFTGGAVGQYYPVTPNDNKQAFSFFSPAVTETNNLQKPDQDADDLTTDRVVSLIVWFNAKRMGYTNFPPYEILKEDVKKVLARCGDVMELGSGAEEEIAEVYQGYRLPEDTFQFLMFPYGAFRIDFTVRYRLAC